ncbi:MAG: hypothetical protein ACK5Z5_05855 [Neisseriaceae bacterium]
MKLLIVILTIILCSSCSSNKIPNNNTSVNKNLINDINANNDQPNHNLFVVAKHKLNESATSY